MPITNTKYQSRPRRIPFYDEDRPDRHIYKLKLFVEGHQSKAAIREKEDDLIKRARKYFIMAYFPEFYTDIHDREKFYTFDNVDPDVNRDIRLDIRENTTIANSYHLARPGPLRTAVIFRLDYDIDAKRQELEDNEQFPPFESNLEFFNERNNITPKEMQTTFVVGDLAASHGMMINTMQAFDSQLTGFEGNFNMNLDFNSAASGIQRLLNWLINDLARQLKSSSPSYQFNQADTITIFFGNTTRPSAIVGNADETILAISKIEYSMIDEGIVAAPLKLGYFTNIKYRTWANDPMTLNILKNYHTLASGIQNAESQNGQYSFWDFLNDPAVRAEAGTGSWSIFAGLPRKPKEAKEIYQDALKDIAKEFGFVDMKDPRALENFFQGELTSKEVRELHMKIANNPDVYRQIFASQQSKVLTTATKAVDVITRFTTHGLLGFASKDPMVDHVIRSLGIDELAKEAMLCLTFGASFEIGRVGEAMKRVLIKEGSSIYYPPVPPKQAAIVKPKIDPQFFKPFTITGDIWKIVLKIVVDALQQMVLQLITGLAMWIKENCPFTNPRASDYGATDIADLLNTTNLAIDAPIVAGNSQLDLIAAKNNLSTEALIAYLRSLSTILSSVEVCLLFQDRPSVSDELMTRILEFNQEYQSTPITNGLRTPIEIMGFFADLSLLVDISDLCNEIANEMYMLNQDNLCLTMDDLADLHLDELLDIIENGLRVDLPEINLDCPEQAGYLADPTITVSVPETFNALVEAVELQFISSADAIKSVMLEPVISAPDGPGAPGAMLDAFANAGVDFPGEGNPFVAESQGNFLGPVISAFDKIDIGFDNFLACPSILGFDFNTFVGGAEAVFSVVNSTMKSPEFAEAMGGLTAKLESLNPQASVSAKAVFNTYVFNVDYVREFTNYVNPEELWYTKTAWAVGTDDASELSMPLYYRSFTRGSTTSWYNPVEIYFNFPFNPFDFTPYGHGDDATAPVAMSEMDEVPLPGEPVVSEDEIGSVLSLLCNDKKQVRLDERVLYEILSAQTPAAMQQRYYFDNWGVLGPDFRGEAGLALHPKVPEVFLDFSPQVANDITLAGSFYKVTPLKRLTPFMLDAVQNYIEIHQEVLLAQYGPIAGLMRRHEERLGCYAQPLPEQTPSPWAPPGGNRNANWGAVGQRFIDRILNFSKDDLEPATSYLKLRYPEGDPQMVDLDLGNPNLEIEFNSTGDYIPAIHFIESIQAAESAYFFEEEVVAGQNVYIKQFVDSFIQRFEELGVSETRAVEQFHFPAAYGVFVENMIHYIVRNGIFDAATLQSLNFFHSNENCPPNEVADLLDVRGILDQMKYEYAESACNDKSLPQRKKIRNMIKFGMYLLLIQIHVAEFIIKNIFVFAAFKIESLLKDREGFMFKFFRNQIVSSMLTYLRDAGVVGTLIQNDLVEYFNMKIARPKNAEQGIRFTNGEIAFPGGTQFSTSTMSPFPGFDEILDYLIYERLLIGVGAIDNAIKKAIPGNNPVSFDHALLASIPTYTIHGGPYRDPATGEGIGLRKYVEIKANEVFTVAEQQPRIFITRQLIEATNATGFTSTRSKFRIWYFYRDYPIAPVQVGGGSASAPKAVELMRFEQSIPYSNFIGAPGIHQDINSIRSLPHGQAEGSRGYGYDSAPAGGSGSYGSGSGNTWQVN